MKSPQVVCVLAMACGTTPTLTAVSPDAALPGTTLTLTAAGIDAETTATLTLGQTTRALKPSLIDAEHLSLALPADLSVGSWQISLANGGRVSKPQNIEIWTPDTEAPCSKRYALDASASASLRQVTITRTLPGGAAPTTIVYKAEAVKAIEHTLDPSGPCSAIWLVTSDDRRVLLADDDRASLLKAAKALADGLQIPFTTPTPAN